MFGIRPIEVYSVNDFQVVDEWSIPNGTPATISFILTKNDSLGERRYIPAVGSTVQLLFVRARAASFGSQAETITKSAIPRADDRSMFDVTLTAEDTRKIISGGVQMVLNESGSSTSLNIPYVVKKSYSDPGY